MQVSSVCIPDLCNLMQRRHNITEQSSAEKQFQGARNKSMCRSIDHRHKLISRKHLHEEALSWTRVSVQSIQRQHEARSTSHKVHRNPALNDESLLAHSCH